MGVTLNSFEEKVIKNHRLPLEWQSQESLDGLLTFLQQNWEQRKTLFSDIAINSKQQYLSFVGQRGIRTNNYVGTIVYKGQKLNIFPKVFREDKDDDDTSDLDLKHLMHNLSIWIEYCNKMDYPYINITSEIGDNDDLKDLFITIFVKYLQAALDRGMYYKYEDIVDNSKTIKGKLNIKDYLVNKYPNGKHDTFECEFSTFEIDNLFNRIIKYVCKSIMNKTSSINQKQLRRIVMKLNDVTDVRCVPSDCDKIRLNYLQKRYRVILSLCKMFLLNKTTTYDLDKTESFCFLFPTEMLFEGFIGGFIKNALEGSANVILQESSDNLVDDIEYEGVHYGHAFQLRHDIFVKHSEKGIFILDTKYKQTSRFEGSANIYSQLTNEIDIQDIRQVGAYAITKGTTDVYLLYPLFRFEDKEPSPAFMTKKIKFQGTEYNIKVHVIRLPFVFEDDVESTKTKLRAVIDSIFE